MSGVAGLYSRAQGQAIRRMMSLAAAKDKRSVLRAFKIAEMLAPDADKRNVRLLREKIERDHPAVGVVRRGLEHTNPLCRDTFIRNFIIHDLLRGQAKRNRLMEKTGMQAPLTILVSPSMRCNLTCEGCYASEYSPEQDLDPALLQRIVDEGNEMGVYLFTFLGGEPLLYRGILDFVEANPDSMFQMFTNGTLLDDSTVERMGKLGNIAPMLSIDGPQELTDSRRGAGVHAKVLASMDRLRKAGVLFGYSSTVTCKNFDTLVSDDFVDMLTSKGALLGWYFLYMPIGRDPDTTLMPSPRQREQFRRGILRIRDTKPLFAVDFWGDAPWVGGCIAGRHYVHITSEGWVEPCIFTHFATDNINDTSLLGAFNSHYFRCIRSRQPYHENLLRPCMWLDNPDSSKAIMAETGARPTHDGGDAMLELHEELEAYATECAEILDPVWERFKEAMPSGGAYRARPNDGPEQIAS